MKKFIEEVLTDFSKQSMEKCLKEPPDYFGNGIPGAISEWGTFLNYPEEFHFKKCAIGGEG